MKYVIKRRQRFLLLLLVVLGLVCVCGKEQEIPILIDEDELMRYLAETEEGRDLFRTSDLFTSNSFSIPLDDICYYRIVIDSIIRSMELTMDHHSIFKDFGDVGLKRDAEVVIDDIFYTRTIRTCPTDTSETKEACLVTRYAYFRKIGDDTQPYAGWKLYGYNPGSPKNTMRVTVTAEGGLSFPGDTVGFPYETFRYIIHYNDTFKTYNQDSTNYRIDSIVPAKIPGETNYRYVKLSDIANIGDGDRLVIKTRDVANRSYYQLMSAATDAGWGNSVAHRWSDSSHYLDTLKTPTNNPRLWNLVFLREFWRVRIPGGTGSDSMAVYSHG
ncbi:MAG: hypothetical protein ABII79_02730 [bacterium]